MLTGCWDEANWVAVVGVSETSCGRACQKGIKKAFRERSFIDNNLTQNISTVCITADAKQYGLLTSEEGRIM